MKRRPNGTGSVVKLSGNRRNPFEVRSPSKGLDERGNPIYEVLGYTANREDGYRMLDEYIDNPYDPDLRNITLGKLYERWKRVELPDLGRENQKKMLYCYSWIQHLEKKKYRLIDYYDMKTSIDNCSKSNNTKGSIKALWGHLDTFALRLRIIAAPYSTTLKAPPVESHTSRVPFTDQEIQWLWSHAYRRDVQQVLILIYTGLRINEFLSLQQSMVNLTEMTLQCGIKTEAGKDRIIPIHARIQPFIQEFYQAADPNLFRLAKGQDELFRRSVFRPVMADMGSCHTPHECRHTFRSRLDAAGANEKCMDLLMGHSTGSTGRKVYTHKTIADLRATIALLD